jgi:hypothetical protein
MGLKNAATTSPHELTFREETRQESVRAFEHGLREVAEQQVVVFVQEPLHLVRHLKKKTSHKK